MIALANRDLVGVMSPLEFGRRRRRLPSGGQAEEDDDFLQDGLQKNDGTLTLGGLDPLPPALMPGRIHYYDVSGAGLGSDSFDFPHVESISNASLGPPIDPARACSLGHNLYEGRRQKRGSCRGRRRRARVS